MYFKDQKIYHVNAPQNSYDLPKPLNVVSIGRGRAKYEMLEIYAGFDIETTTITTPEGHHLAFAYHFQVSIGTPRILNIYLFRTWDNVIHFFNAVADFYGLNDKKHIIISIANMGFEFQFLRKRLVWDEGDWDFFAKERHKPLKATYRGIEFREVLSITGGNLAQLAKDYCTTQKLVTVDEDGVKHSDLDYSKLRNSTTKLTPIEEQYCINDVVILSEFMWWLFCNFIRSERRVPMTFTGILHNEFKQELKDLCVKRDDKLHQKHGTSCDAWMDYMYTLQPATPEEYHLYMNYLFRGGYVHANALYAGLDEIDGKPILAGMMDVTSFYPTQMNLAYTVRTPFRPCEFSEDKVLSKCLIIHAVFDFIRPTTTHTIESKNKLLNCINGHFDNGRLISADLIEVYLTELDYQVYKKFYRWEGMTVLDCQEAERGPLPVYVTNVLNRHYKTKEQLKRTGYKDTTEYQIAKSRVNSCYGDAVKKVRFAKTSYNNEVGWFDVPEPLDYDKEIRKAILSPFYGIWCTSWCRFTITSMIYKLTRAGVACLYTDTDSIKFVPCHKATQIFKHFNNSIRKHRHNRKLRSTFFDGLGEFDIEVKDKKTGKMIPVRFKSLGAKRYIYAYGDKVFATVAGMPKAAVKQLGTTPDEVMKKFTKVGFRLDPAQSGKLTTAYTDEEYSAEIDGEVMTELSGVALYEIPFKITVATEYSAYMEMLQIKNSLEEKCL